LPPAWSRGQWAAATQPSLGRVLLRHQGRDRFRHRRRLKDRIARDSRSSSHRHPALVPLRARRRRDDLDHIPSWRLQDVYGNGARDCTRGSRPGTTRRGWEPPWVETGRLNESSSRSSSSLYRWRTPMSQLSPARIMEVGMAFWPAKVCLSAIELGLFTTLGATSMTGSELQRALGLHPRANPDFFDALLALGFLERDGDGAGARYRNTEETALFLDRNSPRFMGGFLEMANARLYRFWGDLTEGLRTGTAQNETKHTGAPMFDELYSQPERLEQFMDAMSGISAGNFQSFAEKFDFSAYRTLCDIGGATGLLSMLVARQHPHMRCTSADLPAVTRPAHRKMSAAGPAHRASAN